MSSMKTLANGTLLPMHTQQNSCLHFLQVMWLHIVSRHDLYKYGHSLATTVFLYSALTFGALFGIGLDPVCRLAIVLAFLQPQLGNSTQDGSMIRVDVATKAKSVAMRASNGRHDCL